MTTKKTQTIKTKEIEHEESEAPLAVAKKKEAKEAKEIKESVKIFKNEFSENKNRRALSRKDIINL